MDVPGDRKFLPKYLTTVTPLSKFLAAFLFIVLPFLGFAGGQKYQQLISISEIPKDCPSSGSVSVAPAPTPVPIVIPQGSNNLYVNLKYGFSFSYPKAWELHEYNSADVAKYGMIVKVSDPDTTRVSEGYFDSFNVSFYKSINEDYAKGGSWVGQRNYQDLQDFFADPNVPFIHKIGNTIIDGKPAYEATIGGNGQMYSIMLQTDQGVYELGFPRAWDKTKLVSTEKQVLSSFKFLPE